jgi:hypothetical protein
MRKKRENEEEEENKRAFQHPGREIDNRHRSVTGHNKVYDHCRPLGTEIMENTAKVSTLNISGDS